MSTVTDRLSELVLDVQVGTTSELSSERLAQIRELLTLAYDGEFTDADWYHTLGGVHVVVAEGDSVVAHAAVVSRNLEVGDKTLRCGYVEGVATAPTRQGEGLGSLVVEAAATVACGSYDIGALSTGRRAFYERLGWEPWQGPTFVRTAAGLVRTEDEDDGVMILRTPDTPDLDVTAPIACPDRAGDAW